MRIAMIGHKRVPSRIGGIEVVVSELSKRMAAWNHSVMIYNRYYGGEKLTEWEGCQISEVPTPSQKKKWSAMVYSLRATLRAIRQNYDIFHFHAEGPCAMIPLAKLRHKTCVATIHGLDWQRAKWGAFASFYIKFGERMAAKHADRIIVLSRGVQQYFMNTYGRKTTFIPNGVEKHEPREANLIKEKYGLEKDGYVLFLARITPEKGLHYLLDAYAQVMTDLPLVVAGALEPETEYIQKIKQMAEADSRVKLIGFVQGELLEELYSNCRLYVLPSEVEGMPMSLLEAMSFRAPCLVSDIPENKDIVPDYASLFNSSDTYDLKEKLIKILSAPVKRFTEEEVAEMLKNYDWDEITRKTLQEYVSARHI